MMRYFIYLFIYFLSPSTLPALLGVHEGSGGFPFVTGLEEGAGGAV